MGVPSIAAQELRAPAVPPSARTPSRGAPDQAPKEAAPVAKPANDADAGQTQRQEPATLSSAAGVRLRIDKATSQIIAQIVDENNKVVRQVPPEEVLKIAESTRQLQGLLFDESA